MTADIEFTLFKCGIGSKSEAKIEYLGSVLAEKK